MPTGKLTSSRNISEHVKLIAGQVAKSLQDPESRQLAVKIVSQKVEWKQIGRDKQPMPYVKAWGQLFKMRPDLNLACPPRVDECEIAAIWDFLILNCRYVFDITDVDTFVTLQWTLDAGGGDCFPAGTQLLRSDGRLVPVDNIEIGQRIWGRNRWSTVVNKWEKSLLSVTEIQLDNGRSFRVTDDHKVYIAQGERVERIAVSALFEGAHLLQPALVDIVNTQELHEHVFGAQSTEPAHCGVCFAPSYTLGAGGHASQGACRHAPLRTTKVTRISRNVQTVKCYDIATDDHYVYLPDADVTVSNCDDATIAFATLLKAIGFQVRARVISTQDDPDTWSHIYPLVGVPKDNPQTWVPLDITVTDSVPGWEYPHIASANDYKL